MMPASARVLLEGLIDYAGLYPPACLDMSATVQNYADCRESEWSWALGRLVVPAPRLKELADKALHDIRWPLAVLLGENPDEEAQKALAFCEHDGRFTVDCFETKTLPTDILPRPTYVETPNPTDAIEQGFYPKIRMGGITPDLIPHPQNVARFLMSIGASPFKATAGLHHPFCDKYPLTYEPNPPRSWMHGYVNLAVAAMLNDEAEMVDALASHRSDFQFQIDQLTWRDRAFDLETIRALRRRWTSYGSCSFAEPTLELLEHLK